MQYIWEYLDLDMNQLENKQRGDYLGHVQRVGETRRHAVQICRTSLALRKQSYCSLGVSFVYEPSACSQARATTRRPLEETLRGGAGDQDPLRAGGLINKGRCTVQASKQDA